MKLATSITQGANRKKKAKKIALSKRMKTKLISLNDPRL